MCCVHTFLCCVHFFEAHIFAAFVKTHSFQFSCIYYTSNFPCISKMPTQKSCRCFAWSWKWSRTVLNVLWLTERCCVMKFLFAWRTKWTKQFLSWVILKSVTSCTPNRISSNIHGKYVTKNWMLKKAHLGVDVGVIKEKVKRKEKPEPNTSDLNLSWITKKNAFALSFRCSTHELNSISSCFSQKNRLFFSINEWNVFQWVCVWLLWAMHWNHMMQLQLVWQPCHVRLSHAHYSNFGEFEKKIFRVDFWIFVKENKFEQQKYDKTMMLIEKKCIFFFNERPWRNRLLKQNQTQAVPRKSMKCQLKRTPTTTTRKNMIKPEISFRSPFVFAIHYLITERPAFLQSRWKFVRFTVKIGQWFNACN